MSSGVTKCHVGRITWVRRIRAQIERALDRPFDRAVVHAEPDSPFRGVVLLRLDGAAPGDERLPGVAGPGQ